MGRDGRPPLAKCIGPAGEQMTIADLPPRDTVRWVIRRKARVVAAVQGGLLTLNDACVRYNLSAEEFLGWQRAVEHNGVAGLRVTHAQDFKAALTRH